MKRLTLLFATVGLAVMLFSSCQKTTNATPAQASSQSPAKSVKTQVGVGGGDGYYPLPNATLHYVPLYGYCLPGAWDCYQLPPIVIHGYGGDILNAQNGGPLVVKQLFSSEAYQPVCDAIGAVNAAKLKSGEYAIKETINNAQYVTFIAQKDSVSNTNYDFAVQLNQQ